MHEASRSPGVVCGRSCRVALLGDSHTAGFAYFSGPKISYPSDTCNTFNSIMCRGSYPDVLQGLLGPDANVTVFAKGGQSAVGLLPPSECAPALKAHAKTAVLVRCMKALAASAALTSVAAFDPHVIVVGYGTNDASDLALNRTGIISKENGYRAKDWRVMQQTSTTIQLLVDALRDHKPSALRSILLLEPPLTMSESPVLRLPSATTRDACLEGYRNSTIVEAGVLHVVFDTANDDCSCASYHRCRWHPMFQNPMGCWMLEHCTACGPGERIVRGDDKNGTMEVKGCIRADALVSVRSGVREASTIKHVPIIPLPIAAVWRNYVDTIHLNAISAAAMACHVLEALRSEDLPPCANATHCDAVKSFCTTVVEHTTQASRTSYTINERKELLNLEMRVFFGVQPKVVLHRHGLGIQSVPAARTQVVRVAAPPYS